MDNLVYGDFKTPKILKPGEYLNYKYVIVSYGSHPCAYVQIPKDHCLYNPNASDMDYMDIVVHGGVTYAEKGVCSLMDNEDYCHGFWIGWDYAHGDDYYYDKYISSNGNQYTIGDIYTDVCSVINQLIKKQNSAEFDPNEFDKGYNKAIQDNIDIIEILKREDDTNGFDKGYNKAIQDIIDIIETLKNN